jgi:GDPmannose 4,6-dehydratase
MKKKAFITGITGQDGSYLAEFLIDRNYEVHGLIRRSSSINTWRLDSIYQDPHVTKRDLFLHYGDLNDASRVSNLLEEIKPQEIYNLAAQSHVAVSFDQPVQTADIVAVGNSIILEVARRIGSKIYQASSSEMYGKTPPPQNEESKFHPRSPYATAKLFAYWNTINYRESYGLHASNGILFNHESPRRGETFVTRKISLAVARIALGQQKKLFLGNLNAKRDWGFAPEYVEAMWKMLQQDEPDDYVIATGESISVKDFCVSAFETLDLNWEKYTEVDTQYLRPAEVDNLQGDFSKAKRKFAWEPLVKNRELAKLMVKADYARLASTGNTNG